MFFEKCRHILLWQWTDKQRERFYGMDLKTFLTVDRSAQDVMVKKSYSSY